MEGKKNQLYYFGQNISVGEIKKATTQLILPQLFTLVFVTILYDL